MIKRYARATEEEIAQLTALKSLVKKIDKAERRAPRDGDGDGARLGDHEPRKPFAEPITPPAPANTTLQKSYLPGNSHVFSDIANVEVTRDAIIFDNPLELLTTLMPELRPYKWQFEELMRAAGYLTTGKYTSENKTQISDVNPYKVILSCANGSGKDMIIIAAFAVWFALKKARNRVIITSSSFEQTKFQTEVHIRELANRANKRFGALFRYTQFHYVVPELGSEIKLFATDEAKRAEGFHPYGNGEMAIIINEAKSVKEEIFDALSRCTGYSHWLEISSPGPRSGHMFRMAGNSVHYPAPAQLGRFYFRRVSAYECPHIPKAHIDAMAYDKGEDSPWFRSSVKAEFADFDEPVVVTEHAFDKCLLNPPPNTGDDIGIGLDLAGGGDEDACFVRQGNRVVHKFFFRQADTDLAADLIDKHLAPWKSSNYVFRADNGGIGQAIIDKLVAKGWRIRRTNNQSPAFNKREFLNLGAEMYFYVKRLIERCDIVLPNVEKLRLQLTTRRYRGFDSTQGKFALESKQEARSAGRPSPDRGDALVLCFASYKTKLIKDAPKADAPKYLTLAQVLQLSHRGQLRPQPQKRIGFPTYQNGKI